MQLMLVLCLSVFDVVRVLSECTCEKRSQKSVFKEADLVSKVRFHSVEEEGNGDLSLKPLYEQVFKPKNVNETLNGAILMNASLADCNHIMMNEDYLVGVKRVDNTSFKFVRCLGFPQHSFGRPILTQPWSLVTNKTLRSLQRGKFH